ncbi:hypothetical protein PGB90_001080 [Kerria lacca]
MSDKGVSFEGLARHQRLLTRQINATKLIVSNAFNENPSLEVAHRIRAHLDECKDLLLKLEDILNDNIEMSDLKDKTPHPITEIETNLMQPLILSSMKHTKAKGRVNAMFDRLNRPVEPERTRVGIIHVEYVEKLSDWLVFQYDVTISLKTRSQNYLI